MPALPAIPEHAPTAWAAALGRLRTRLLRTLAFVFVMCGCIALLLAAIEGGRFGVMFVYSLAIGAACTALSDGVRLLYAWCTDRLRAARGLPASDGGFGSGWRGIVPAALVTVLAGPATGLWLGDLLTGSRSPSLLRLDASGTRVTLVLSVLATAVAIFVLSTLERLASARAQAESAQRLAAETQLRLLQSQLEPHMLFNTLANLRVLIGIDPLRAQAMLDRLIAFLRTTLGASRATAHPLATEFEHLADYLELMAVRMGPRLEVRLALPADLGPIAVPPLLLQPLVENAIKHGLEPKVEGGRVEVAALRIGARLRLTVRDTGVGLDAGAPPSASSFGLEQVRTRLATLYGQRAMLSLESAADAEGGALATLELPLDGDP